MQLDKMSHNGETQSKTPMIAVIGSTCLAKILKNVWKKFGLDADSVIGHANDSLSRLVRDGNKYVAPRRSEFYRVRQEIPHHLMQAFWITANNVRSGGNRLV